MTKIYHCTPEELDRQPNSVIDLHLEFMRIDNEQEEINEKRQAQMSKIKRKK